jgi:NAD(P)H-nitrite reductase large subunit
MVVGKGIECPVTWLKDQGFTVNKGIVVNEYLETEVQGVWAAGDVAEFNDLLLGDHMILGNWVNAQLQGRRAGLNMTGTRKPFKRVTSYTAQGAGLIISFVGDTRPMQDRTVVLRGSPSENKYGRILLKNNKVIGATLINLPQEMGGIVKAIETGENVMG